MTFVISAGGDMSIRRFAIGSVLAALVGVCIPASAQAANSGDSASGHFKVSQGLFDVDFSARSSAFGTGSTGRARISITAADPNSVYSGDVTCLRVVGTDTGALAVIGVRLTRAPFGTIEQGLELYVFDGGKFSQQPDLGTFAFTPTPPPQDACPAPVFGQPVDGEITVQNTFP
jgi:hypothetical protein